MSNYFCLRGGARKKQRRDIKWEFAMRTDGMSFSGEDIAVWRHGWMKRTWNIGNFSKANRVLGGNSLCIVWCFSPGVCEHTSVHKANCSLQTGKQIDFTLGVKWFLITVASERMIPEYPLAHSIASIGKVGFSCYWWLLIFNLEDTLKWKHL